MGAARREIPWRWIRVGLVATLLTAAILTPVVAYGIVVTETAGRELVARQSDERVATGQIAGASIDRILADAIASVALFAANPSLKDALLARDRGTLDRRLLELLQGRRNSLGAVLDPSGIAISAPLAPDLVGLGFAQRDYFKGALPLDGPYVSEIFTSASPGNPSVVAVATAVRDDSRLLGVVVLTLSPDDLLSTLQPLLKVEGRELLLVDQSGRVVASTDETLRPLARLDVPAGTPPPDVPIAIAGRQAIVTTGFVTSAQWTLYVMDDPAVVLGAVHQLRRDLREAGGAVGLITLVATALVVGLYVTMVRQREKLRRSSADLAEINLALHQASGHKSEFLASMSHELRTPLNAVLGFAQLLEEQLSATLTDRHRRYLRNIHDAGEHLLGLINDVLDLSKVEAGRLDLRPEVIGLGPLLEPVIASTRAAARVRDIVFDFHGRTEGVLSVDPARVRQILYNLLSNAVKFTPPNGAVTLTVEEDGADLVVEVSDTGIGIPADKRDRVFGTFERLHEGRSDAPGTGLGLALTRSLVDLHRGAIVFRDRVGGGTVFQVRLPDVVLTGAPSARLLIVEDEARDADLIAALARKAGLATEVARSAQEAMAAIARSVPLGVVLDLRLGGQRGEEVLKALKADPATRAVPVIVVTVEDDQDRSRALGADDHLTKPIDHGRLGGWLEQVAARLPRSSDAGLADLVAAR